MHTAHCVRSEYLSALRKYTIQHTQLLRHTPRLHDYYITSLTVLEEFTNHTLPALKILAEGLSLIRQSYLYQKWSAADWFFGLLVYAHQHRTSREPAVRNAIKSSAARSTSPQVGSLVKYVRICDAIYAPTTEQFCAESGIPQSRVIRVHSGGVLFPKSILLLDHADKEVIVAIRGSASILDFCIDLCLLHEPFLDGYGHRGIAHASRWMLQHSESDILDLHERYPDYSVVFTGHSLGAGLAALASIALHRKSSDTLREKLLCIGFATPACITPQLARDCRPFVTSIIHGDDCIPRLHQHSLLRLQKLVSTFDWRTSLKQMIVEELEGQKNRAHDHFASTINEQTQLVRKTRERMQQIRQRRDGSFQHINYIITRLEDLKFDEKRAEASAKMTQVGKKIGEQVRDQFSGKWYAALEYFHMDQLDLHKVEELKKALLAKYDWVGALTSTEEKVKKLTEKVVVRGNDLKAHVPPQLGHWYSQLTRLYDIAIGQLGPRSTDSTQPEEKVHRLEAKMQLMAESDMEQNKNPSKKASEWSEEPLVSPGRVLYLVQKDGTEGTAVLEPVDNDSFNEVLLSDNMIRDHLCTTYEEVLRALHDQMEKVHSENR